MTLVKENLIQSLYDQCGLSKQQSRVLVEAIFEEIKKALAACRSWALQFLEAIDSIG